MKLHLKRFLCLALIASLLLPAAAGAEAEGERLKDEETGFLYTVSEGAAVLLGIESDAPVRILAVPDTIGGVPVRRIGNDAFRGMADLFYVNISEGTRVFGDGAFADCPMLSVVHMPETLEEIGAETFKNCVSLISLTIPEKTETVGEDAFAGCIPTFTLNLKEDSPLGEYALRSGVAFTYLPPC